MNENVKNLYQFLRDFNDLKNPVITDINSYDNTIELYNLPNSKFCKSGYIDGNFDDYILKVNRPIIEQCPELPISLEPWVQKGYEKYNIITPNIIQEIELKETDKQISGNQNEVKLIKKFQDDPNLVSIFNDWNFKRSNWRERNIENFKSEKIFNDLYNIYMLFQKESENYEIVIADLLLNISNHSQIINHQLFFQRIEISYESNDDSFEVNLSDVDAKLYDSLLRNNLNAKPERVGELNKVIEELKPDIHNELVLDKLKEKLVLIIRQSFTGQNIPFTLENKPIILVRKKIDGFYRFINQIIDDLDQNDDILIPKFINDLLVPGNIKEDFSKDIFESVLDGLDKDILLTLPANNEQLRITKALNKRGAVLVQGPPGTGKTHTIANLIGHLLSEGKSVLVTSQTDKALAVLKEKIYKDDLCDLQSLCISVNQDRKQRNEIDFAIDAISNYQNRFDEDLHKNKITDLTNKRNDLLNQLIDIKTDYKVIRNLEHKDIVYNGENIKPIKAATFIGDGLNKYDYLNFSTENISMGLPLTNIELENLYRINFSLTYDESKILLQGRDIFKKFWEPEILEQYKIKIDNLSKNIKDTELKISSDQQNETLMKYEIITEILKDLDKIKENKSFFNYSLKESNFANILVELLKDAKDHSENFSVIQRLKFEGDININYISIDDDVANEFQKIINKKQNDAFTKVMMFFPNRKKLFESIETNLDLNIFENLEKIYKVYRYELTRNDYVSKINRLFTNIENVDLLTIENFEQRLKYSISIIESLNIYDKRFDVQLELVDEYKTINLQRIEESDNPFDEFTNFLTETKIIYENILNSYFYNEEINKYNEFQKNVLSSKYISVYFENLLNASQILNINEYKENYAKLEAVYSKSDEYELRNELLNKINSVAPMWASMIKNKDDFHNTKVPPERIEEAWKYNQLRQQLEIINKKNARNIEDELKDKTTLIMRNAQLLAHEKSWFQSVSKQTSAQTQALVAWRQVTMKMPKTKTAKTAPRLRKQLRELMPQCQNAIPVWIMSLSKVVENYNPTENKFDVIIIDEASQADMLALSVLYMGKQIIVVGDDKQVSPDIVGLSDDKIVGLQNQYLSNISIKNQFAPTTSIYDLAQLAQFSKVVLTEHFRCYPEIIQFSNINFYNGMIRPLKDPSLSKITSFVSEYRVQGGFRDKSQTAKLNINEANMTVAIILSMLKDPNYDEKTIGVISMLGNDQSNYIQSKLHENISTEISKERKIICGSPYQFQGDERDIILINLVDSSETVKLVAEDQKGGTHAKAYNVATSRAKDQLIVVHSLNPSTDLKQDDLRSKLITYVRNPKTEYDDELMKKAESPFEEEVLKELLKANYEVHPQFKIAGYRIDIVVQSGKNRVAVELDGEKYHTEDNFESDLLRQAQLERLGWRFIRIRGSEYYSNKNETIQRLFKKLERFDIFPSLDADINIKKDTHNEIYRNMIQNAELIFNNNFEKFEYIEKDNHGSSEAYKRNNVFKNANALNQGMQTNKYNLNNSRMSSKPTKDQSSKNISNEIEVNRNYSTDEIDKYFEESLDKKTQDLTITVNKTVEIVEDKEPLILDVSSNKVSDKHENIEKSEFSLYKNILYRKYVIDDKNRMIEIKDIVYHDFYGYGIVESKEANSVEVRFYKNFKKIKIQNNKNFFKIMDKFKIQKDGHVI